MKIRIENSNAGFTDDVMNIIIENEECKWPNLKQLIEAKTDLKFRIKDEQQSKELQEFFFALDVYWHYGDKQLWDLKERNLISSFYGKKYCLLCDNEDDFIRNDAQAFDLENDCLVEEETIKRIKFNKTNLRIIEIEKILNKIKEDQ